MTQSRYVLGALLVGALGIGASGSAQTGRDSAHVRAQHVALDSIQRSVLPPLTSYCSAKWVAAYVKTACAILTRQIRSAIAAESALVVSTNPPPPPPPVDTTFVVVAASDFESGSFAPQFWNPWAGGIDVVADPTLRATGKVARYHYTTNGTTQADHNLALLPTGTVLRLGQEMVFQGDFYLDATARMDASGSNLVQRKLFRFGSDDHITIPTLEFELTSFGPQFNFVFQPSQAWTEALGTGPTLYIDTAIAKLTAGAWHHLKVRLVVNSSFVATNGLVQCWYDGILILDHSALWVGASWVGTYDPTKYVWDDFGVGDQVSAAGAVDEYRYWDNLSFSIKR